MDSTTRRRTAYRDVLIGLLTGLDELDEPDVQEVLYGFLDNLKEGNSFDVALGAFEIINRLAAELSAWTGKSRTETLSDLAVSIAQNPIP
jgi:hypothetical protein